MGARVNVTFAVLAALAAGAADAARDGGLPTDRIFAPDSFWYTPIPADAPLHPDSEALAAEFLRQKERYYGTVTLNTEAYASPVYLAARDTPRRRVRQWNCQNKARLDAELLPQWEAVPIPDYAQPSAGTDAEMTVYQPATDTLWEFWKTRRVDGEWEACWGGRMQDVSASDGRWPRYFGTTATGLPFLGGQVTAEELERGEIRHALGIALVDLDHHRVVSWPAMRSDGHNPDRLPHRIAAGQRLRIDPSVDLDALPMHPVARTIARAGQKYGFVVWDHAGALSLRAQNPLSYTVLGRPDPYEALFAGTPKYKLLAGIPWERLQFLPIDYGKPARERGGDR
jgi:hypothetical protein